MKSWITALVVAFSSAFFSNADESKEPAAPKVSVKTNHGSFVIELNPVKAPITVKNFLSYVDKKHYDGTVFHRVMGTFMIQGGGFADKDGKLVEKATGEGIKNEAANGLTNAKGTVAMARTPLPDSATAQFFVNVVDNGNRLDPAHSDGHGYAVFGKVVEGMDVVEKIKAVPTGMSQITMIDKATGQTVTQAVSDVPTQKVVIESITRLEK
jgi:peptidyl-prolyl cis-trans isomerase A (cyclophilin A)